MSKEFIVQLILLFIVLVGGYWLCKVVDYYYEKKKPTSPGPKKVYTHEQIQILREMRKLTWIHGKLQNALVVYLDGVPYTREKIDKRAKEIGDWFHNQGFSPQDLTRGILDLKENGYPPKNGF